MMPEDLSIRALVLFHPVTYSRVISYNMPLWGCLVGMVRNFLYMLYAVTEIFRKPVSV
jgi:hypothetical protein